MLSGEGGWAESVWWEFVQLEDMSGRGVSLPLSSANRSRECARRPSLIINKHTLSQDNGAVGLKEIYKSTFLWTVKNFFLSPYFPIEI